MDRPSPSKDVLQVLPTATLPVHLTVDDQGSAIRSAWLRYRVSPTNSPRDLPLFDYRGTNLFTVGAVSGVGFRSGASLNLRPSRLEMKMNLELGSLLGAEGSKLKHGDMVSLQAFADDFDDIHPAKEPGRGHEVIIQVVGKDTLHLELNKVQGKIQKELQDLLKNQRDALERIREIEIPVRQGSPIPSEKEVSRLESSANRFDQEIAETQKKAEESKSQEEHSRFQNLLNKKREEAEKQRKLAQDLKKQVIRYNEAEQIQQQLRERIGSEKEGLRGEIERFLESMKRNQLENTNNMDRMGRILRELDRISNSELDGIESRLHNAKTLGDNSETPANIKGKNTPLEKGSSTLSNLKNNNGQNEQDQETKNVASSNDKKGLINSKKEKASALEPESNKGNDPNRINRFDPLLQRSLLSEARRGQEEVERTLNQILQDLEPWSTTLEVNSEASRLLQDQKALQGLLEELDNKGQTGKSLNELSETEKTELKNAAESQKRLQDRSQNLLDQMKKLAEKRQTNDPEMAKDLSKAAEEAENGQLSGQMRSAQEHITRNELHEARKSQQASVEQLEKLLRGLNDSRESRLNSLARKLRESQDRVEKIMDEQEKLQRKTREVENISDPEKRERELKQLARKQQDLQKQTEGIRDELSRLGNERARQTMAEAVEEMAEAVKQLSRGQKSNDKQEDILDRMEETRRNLEKTREKTEEELGREQIIRVTDVLRRLRERQESLKTEGERIQDAVLNRKVWSRGLKASLREVGQNQQNLSVETGEIARKDLQATPVFAKLLSFIARAMDQSAGRFNEMLRTNPDWKSLPDKALSNCQQEAMRRFDQLLASMKEALETPRPLSRGADQEKTDSDGAGESKGIPSDDLIPNSAQIKLLRSLQKEINEQTLSFKKKHPLGSMLTTEAREELLKIQKEQKELADLFQRLIHSTEESEEEKTDSLSDKEKGGNKQ
ncbi:MAG: hypothetical protein ACKO23_03420 [Gemmataceae bacterium]